MAKIKINRTELLILFLILVAGAFLRLYKIGGYMTFLGDEGRDAILVRRLLVNFDPILIGPGTSIGNMYLGPLYYYLIAPFLLLFNFSPIGPSIMVAILGIATIFLVWWIAREWFGRESALLVSFLYAIAPTIIIFSRASWNPNVMPFFALVCIYAIWELWQKQKLIWLSILAISFAMVLNSHYLGLALSPIIAIFWLIAFRKSKSRSYILHSVIALGIFLFLMSPLVIFDFRHNFINFNALKKFFLERQTTVSARPWNALPQAWPLWQEFSARLLAGRSEFLGSWVALGLLSSLLLFNKVNKKQKDAFILIFAWLGVSVLALGVYKQHIYDHYFGFFFPAMFLLLAGIFQFLIDNHKIRGWWLVTFSMTFLIFYNLKEIPLKYPPANQMVRAIKVAQKIREEAGDNKFNLAVIAERNYEDGYQYFLEKWDTKVIDIDPLNYDKTVADKLFVVCEKIPTECDPTHSAKAEVANFGWSKIENEWNIDGTTLYELIHTDGKNK